MFRNKSIANDILLTICWRLYCEYRGDPTVNLIFLLNVCNGAFGCWLVSIMLIKFCFDIGNYIFMLLNYSGIVVRLKYKPFVAYYRSKKIVKK